MATLFILTLLTGALAVLGCSSDGDNGGGGNTGGNGGGSIAGLWVGDFAGFKVCFFVSQDETQLTPSDQCDIDQPDDTPFSYELRVKNNAGTNQDNEGCGFGLGYEQTVQITNNSFSVENFSFPNSQDVFSFDGTISGNSASGSAKKVFQTFSCEIDWTATKVGGGNGTGGTGGSGTGGTGGSGTGGTGGSGTGGTGGSTGGGIRGGLWSGTDVCLYVNPAGTKLVPSPMRECDIDEDDEERLSFEWQPSGLDCGISFPQDNEPQTIDIKPDGTFKHTGVAIEFEGTFDVNTDTVSGTANTFFGCPDGGSWSATPN